MQITTGTLTACSGGEHLTLPITKGGVTRNLNFTRTELAELAPNDVERAKEAIKFRLRSAILESGAATPAQVRSAVSGKTFEV